MTDMNQPISATATQASQSRAEPDPSFFEELMRRFRMPGRERPERDQGGRYTVCCPLHPQDPPTLRVAEGPDGGVRLRCDLGCPVGQIAARLGVDAARVSALEPDARDEEMPELDALVASRDILRRINASHKIHNRNRRRAVCSAYINRGYKLDCDRIARLDQEKQDLLRKRQEHLAALDRLQEACRDAGAELEFIRSRRSKAESERAAIHRSYGCTDADLPDMMKEAKDLEGKIAALTSQLNPLRAAIEGLQQASKLLGYLDNCEGEATSAAASAESRLGALDKLSSGGRDEIEARLRHIDVERAAIGNPDRKHEEAAAMIRELEDQERQAAHGR